MRKIREVLRLKLERGFTHRQIAASCQIGAGTVSEYVHRAQSSGLTWDDVQSLSDANLEARLFHQVQYVPKVARAPIDCEWAHQELRRTGVTLQLLWTEYVEAARARAAGPEPYQYTQFCEHYHRWRSRLDLVMRQTHRAGEKAFIDYSGKRAQIIDGQTGEVTDVELFVMVLGASNYTFAEATRSQKSGDFIASIVRALEFFGGVPEVLVPDQLRSAVTGPDRYDPDINATLLDLARHYDTAIIPARPRKPRDKAKVETGVLVVQRWIIARLRHRQFFSLDELNNAIAELVIELNQRPFKKLSGSRHTAFQSIDRPALRPLPARRFEASDRAWARVNIDYHVTFEERLYSTPHSLVGERVRDQSDNLDRRDPVRRRTRGVPSTELRTEGIGGDVRGSPPRVAPRVRQVASRAIGRLGGQARSERAARRGDDVGAVPSTRDGIPSGARSGPLGRATRCWTLRRSLCACSRSVRRVGASSPIHRSALALEPRSRRRGRAHRKAPSTRTPRKRPRGRVLRKGEWKC